MPVDEFHLKLRIEPLDEGGFVITSPDLPGLAAQGRTRAETLETAQDVARRLIESDRNMAIHSREPSAFSSVSERRPGP
jgi:predicted RNase H-like HicB family nuclease